MESGKTLPDQAKPFIRWGGYVLLAAALVYCGLALRDLGSAAVVEQLSNGAWVATLGLGLAYGAALVCLAVGWIALCAPRGTLSISETVAIYGPAVIAKYIPGSIFQYGSRQLNGAEFGLGQKAMAKASLAEAAIHIPAALLCAGVLWLGGGFVGLGALGLAGLAAGAIAARGIVRAAGLQIAFFAAFAALMMAIASLATSASDPAQLTAMFMLAWVAGFLVPVAPGGIGVRESALLALAVPAEQTALVLAFALLTRLATTLGDLAIGLGGYGLLLSSRWNRQASA